jgi:hypothetical protein
LLSQSALKSNPSRVTTTVSISLRAAAPVAGAENRFRIGGSCGKEFSSVQSGLPHAKAENTAHTVTVMALTSPSLPEFRPSIGSPGNAM